VEQRELFDDPTTVYSLIGDQLRRSTRLVVWDKRGTGLSDPATTVPTLDERMDDLRAVIDCAGIDCAALFGVSEGGPMSILFAATYPERVTSLVLYGTAARLSQQLPDFPWGFTPAEIQSNLAEIDTHWGDGALTELFYGTAAELPGVREMWSREQRVSASPSMARLLWESLQHIDVRDVLRAVHAPTLVIARRGDRIAPYEASADMAKRIAGAQLLSLPPGEHDAIDIVGLLTPPILEFVCDEPLATRTHRVGEVLASRTVRDLSVGSGLHFESLGAHRLKGLPDETEVFRVG
jgi:pimeloyl-ACP methyl ester carboxylesterase